MIRPDAIPVRAEGSHIALPAPTLAELFGKGYRLRGAERVRVVAPGRAEVAVPVSEGGGDLILDPLDLAALGGGPLRLVGPKGSTEAPPPPPFRRRLVLPPPLRRAWGLEGGGGVTLQGGSVAWGGVLVEEGGGGPAAFLSRADLLAAGLPPEGGVVRLRRDLDLAPSPSEAPPDPGLRPVGRLITENDVRQARLHGQRIVLGPGQLITPAAQSLARELGVLVPPA